ncbi:hypothetical protein CVT25_012983 [Psilocybe cyanescens]|uniref:Uncharacterized protein n=1 Tax=Psilocybe cyanescens TaxID=93625 RepID=A0A409X7K6_PSICY|nr:hypothetical protein CVT25_012983 [Psilocybe cyanescens]
MGGTVKYTATGGYPFPKVSAPVRRSQSSAGEEVAMARTAEGQQHALLLGWDPLSAAEGARMPQAQQHHMLLETEPLSLGGDNGTSEDNKGPAACNTAGLGAIELRDSRDNKHPAAHNVAGLGTIECRGGDSGSKDSTGPAASHVAGN